MQEQLVAAEVQIAPDTFAVVMLWALAIAVRAPARALPLKPNIDTLELEVQVRFCDIPGVLNS
jgi:hypothetical protein